MTEDILARRLFSEQIRKELIAEIKQYRVGWVHDGEMIATKNSDTWNGHILVIPDEIWDKW